MSSQDPTTGQSKNPEPLPPIPGPASKPGRTQPAGATPPWMAQQPPATSGSAPQDTPSVPTQAQTPTDAPQTSPASAGIPPWAERSTVPAPGAPVASARQAAAPGAPTPRTPTSNIPTPRAPMPGIPASRVSEPGVPASSPRTPGRQTPAPGSYTDGPQAPAPGGHTDGTQGPVPARAGRTGAQGTASQRAQGGTSSTPGAPLPAQTARDNRAGGRATGRPARGVSPVAAQAQRRIGIPLWALVAALVVAIALVVTVIVLAARSCTSPRQPVTPATEQQWVSPYDWSNLKQLENGFLAYYNADGSLASEAGVDVSEHDGDIDWQAVKAAGADFAMIRLGYRGYSQGTLALDDYFLANIKGASDAGLKVGVYFFSQAITADEARQEAQYVIDTLAGLGITLAYPVAFDQEPITNGDVARTDNITDEQLTANAIAFCQAVEQAGYQAMIYGNQHDLARLDLTGELGAYPLWYAEYEAAGNVPTGKFDFAMWQYTASGTVSGIPTTAGQVDMNIRFLG